MSNKDLKNLQNSLYKNVLPPFKNSKHTCNRVLRGLNLTLKKTAKEATESENNNLLEQASMQPSKIVQMLNQVQHDGMVAALTLALSFFIAAPAIAADTPPVPAPAQTDNGAYTLTKVEQPGINVITKYEWSETDNKLVPQYYQVNLNKTEYGYPDIADDTKTFTVTTPNADGSGNAFEYEIKYYVNNSRLAPDRITTDQNGADINNDFVGLNVTTTSSSAYGGAIDNYYGTIDNITGDFIGNYASGSPYAKGGAIYNYSGTIEDITGDFINNYSNSRAGAILNEGSIGDIKGKFIGNYLQDVGSAKGGAIYNGEGSIASITGDFINNYVKTTGERSGASGGALYNNAEISGDITGDFIGNYVDGFFGDGGAIYASSTSVMQNITGDFIKNYVSAHESSGMGGAIYINNSSAKDITGSFVQNYIKASSSAYGGAIYNYHSDITNITGSFIGNYAETEESEAQGGAIWGDKGSSFANI